MPITSSWLDHAETSKYRFIRKFVAVYKQARKRGEPWIARFVSSGIRLLPVRLAARIVEQSVLTVHMPYSLPITVHVDSFRDISRANFPHAEPATVEWIETYLRFDEVLWDIGANIGAVSMIAAAHLKKQCTIYSFEPAFATFPKLCANIMANGFQHVMTPYPFALSQKPGMDFFFYRDTHAGTSGHSLSSSSERGVAYVLRQPVMTYSIDGLCADWGLKRPTHLKIDVDGHDWDVLKGAVQTLRGGNVKTVLIEKNQHEEEIRTLMHDLSYQEKRIASNDNLLFIMRGSYDA